MNEIRIPVPRLPAGLGSNLVGLVGLVVVAVSIGGLVGNWWWSGLVGGVFAVGLAVLAQAQAQPTVEVGAEQRRLAAVPKAS